MKLSYLLVLAATVPLTNNALAADSLQDRLYEVCRSDDAGWIGKNERDIQANCRCKANSEAAMATPEFRASLLKKGVYDPLLIAAPDRYMGQVLTDCPALRPLMIEAMCSDPAAPPDACTAVKDMVGKLK